jgi:predicted AAA+ superfamily ATPase
MAMPYITVDWPNSWIKGDFETLLGAPKAVGPFSCVLLLGPRQVGKSALLNRVVPPGTLTIELDDLDTRSRANRDPSLFAKELKAPLLVDEIQYAPILLSQIKILADRAPQDLKIFLTGSQSFEVMPGVQESLAGRFVILNLLGLSLAEKGILPDVSPKDLFEELFIGGFSALRTAERSVWARFMSSYVQTYVQRDVAELLGIQKRREFELFLRACALRTGQLINYEELARDSAISSGTAKEWLSIWLVHPYFSNRTKRLIKTPKLYLSPISAAVSSRPLASSRYRARSAADARRSRHLWNRQSHRTSCVLHWVAPVCK